MMLHHHKKRRFLLISIACILLCINQVNAQSAKDNRHTRKAEKRLEKMGALLPQWSHLSRNMRIDSIAVNTSQKQVELYLSEGVGYAPIREELITQFKERLYHQLKRRFHRYTLKLIINNRTIGEYIPNYYRKTLPPDQQRLTPDQEARIPIVRRLDKIPATKGLYHKNIALWHSHGYYYNAALDRWQWQRPRLFGTVEDLMPMMYVRSYIVPMLENAGATTFLPRERDTQTNEVIVDNDGSTGNSEIRYNNREAWKTGEEAGFALKDTLFDGENPFRMGSFMETNSTTATEEVSFIPDIPEQGEYAVYLSWHRNPQNSSEVKYSVTHLGGTTEFLVNQQMGGETWIYLGTFQFAKGLHPEMGKITLNTQSTEKGKLTFDALKFGGGMGNVARRPKTAPTDTTTFNWKLSGKPRYMEGARYYLQHAGMSDTLVYSLHDGKKDYNDDYLSRAEWLNYLMGTPNGPRKNRNAGLGIPIDLALAFHTDAGITPDESIIGTLGIYSTTRDNGYFPNKQSKLASRDLTDIIQTQLVNDIQQLFNPQWTRRGMWDKEYSEAWRPNVPAMLLELYSHQNLADVQPGIDPRFQFAVGRAIYKGILRFLSTQNGDEYVVQPLPVNHFCIKKAGNNSVQLSWHPVNDPLEPTATPQRYKIYTREEGKDFDNGFIVVDTITTITLENPEKLYSFKVTALNEGGESFPSEILAAWLGGELSSPVLIVNGFDRISAPKVIDTEQVSGIAWWDDQGVPYKKNYAFTGHQYDFDRSSAWLSDDNPGWGASAANFECKPIIGNTFDFTVVHGAALKAAGYSFVSMSDEAFERYGAKSNDITAIDLLMGEERTIVNPFDTTKTDFPIYTPALMQQLKTYLNNGGNLLLSGAYVGTELVGDTIATAFARDVLHFNPSTNHAVKKGDVYTTDYATGVVDGEWEFNTSYHTDIYTVEAPDAIEPVGENAITAFRYNENNTSAGVVYNGDYKVVVLGFPFETIKDESKHAELMQQMLRFFED